MEPADQDEHVHYVTAFIEAICAVFVKIGIALGATTDSDRICQW